MVCSACPQQHILRPTNARDSPPSCPNKPTKTTYKKTKKQNKKNKKQTPRESAPAFGCPAEGAVDSCPSDPGADSTSNFMQYTDDACMSAFTSGQVARMSALWRRYRGSSGEGALLSEGDGGDGSSGDAAEAPAPAPEREGGDAGAAAAAAEDAAAGADAPAAPPPPPPPPRRRRRVVRGG